MKNGGLAAVELLAVRPRTFGGSLVPSFRVDGWPQVLEPRASVTLFVHPRRDCGSRASGYTTLRGLDVKLRVLRGTRTQLLAFDEGTPLLVVRCVNGSA